MDPRAPARYAVLVVCLLLVTPAYADEAKQLLDDTLASLTAVKTVRAQIEQEVVQLGVTKKFAGSYQAADGHFRVELDEPSTQIIVGDENEVLWFIESVATVWESKPTGTSLGFEPRRIIDLTRDGFDWEAFRTKKLFGLAGDEARFVLTPKASGTSFSKVELFIDVKRKRLMRVELYDAAGKLSATQYFSRYVDFAENGSFPGEVAVTLWTPAGNVKSVSRYRSIVVNEALPADTFELDLPTDVTRKPLIGYAP